MAMSFATVVVALRFAAILGNDCYVEDEELIPDVQLLQTHMHLPLVDSTPETMEPSKSTFTDNKVLQFLQQSEPKTKCKEDADCCLQRGWCPLFCFEGDQITNRTDESGWGVDTFCTVKYEGFCREDDECSGTRICGREAGQRVGACREDWKCSKFHCGEGTCLDGRCLCPYGFAGRFCERSTNAFAFLLYGNSISNLLQARVWARSLRDSGWKHDVLAIVPQAFADQTSYSLLDMLAGDGVKIVYTPTIPMPDSMDADPIIHERWSGVMNKFAIWDLTNYTHIAMTDIDMVWDLDGEHPESVFKECDAQLCAVRDGDERFLNAGLMVITPSEMRLEHLMRALREERHHYEMPEQSFLTKYCAKEDNNMTLQFLDQKWNSCVAGGMLLNKGWATSGFNVLHACSWGPKPPEFQLCFEQEGCDMGQKRHTMLVWQQVHASLDSCILHRAETTCGAAGASCAWCGHYCSDQRVPCDATLFKEALVDESLSSWGSSCTTEQVHAVVEEVTGSWDEAPETWWAWPRVAMYQVLTDRFASPSPELCTNFSDYCGGTFAAMKDKLGYLEKLGVDGVLLSPVMANSQGGYHGYWPVDLDALNTRFGSADDLHELVLAIHSQGMKVIGDVVLNHAGMDPIPTLKPFNKLEHFHPTNCSMFASEDFEGDSRKLERCQLFGLPDFNHENPEVLHGLTEWVRRHVETFGFDGVRIDAARHMPRSFLRHIAQIDPSIPTFYEVPDSSVQKVASYTQGDFDSFYNYPLYFAVKNAFLSWMKGPPMTKMATLLERDNSDRRLMLNFLDNNDEPRFIRLAGGDGALLRSALLCILGAKGSPVLLFGSEQDMQGEGNSSNPKRDETANLWRPPLWHAGYGSTGETFEMIRRVLWLRKKMDGLHRFRQRVLLVDHEALVFARGPLIFAATAGSPSWSQRLVWDNLTTSCEKVRMCDMLAADVHGSCEVVEPGAPLHLVFAVGEPKLFVPEEMLDDFPLQASSGDASSTQGSVSLIEKNPGLRMMSESSWSEVPGVSVDSALAVRRVHRALLPPGLVINDPPQNLPAADFHIPPHLNRWFPTVGMPVQSMLNEVVGKACHRAHGEGGTTLYVRGSSQMYLLGPENFTGTMDTTFDPAILDAFDGSDVSLKGVAKDLLPIHYSEVPVLYLTSWVGYYHSLNFLPRIGQFLSELQAGKMRLLINEENLKYLTPVLRRLGIDIDHTVLRPSTAPVICAQRWHIQTSSAGEDITLYSRYAMLRENLQLPTGPLPCGAARRSVVILSRGNSSRTISNEEELAQELRSLGRPVEIANGGSMSLPSMIEVLSRAEVLVGAHGANLMNMIYAPEGTKVLEIVPQVPFKMVNYHYWALAGALSFPYIPVGQHIGASDINKELAKHVMTQDHAFISFAVDTKKIVTEVAALLGM